MVIQPKEPVSLILAHGNPLVLGAMSEVFERDPRFSLVATSATSEGYLGIALRLSVHVSVLDWNLPDLGGAKVIDVMRGQIAPPRFVVYGDSNGDVPRQAMTAGAAAFVARNGPVKDLLDACYEVAFGKMIFPFMDIRALQMDPIEQLSKRERVMLQTLAQGLTNRELAKALDISTNTVKFHLSNLYDKLAVKNRGQAIAFYYASRTSGAGGGSFSNR